MYVSARSLTVYVCVLCHSPGGEGGAAMLFPLHRRVFSGERTPALPGRMELFLIHDEGVFRTWGPGDGRATGGLPPTRGSGYHPATGGRLPTGQTSPGDTSRDRGDHANLVTKKASSILILLNSGKHAHMTRGLGRVTCPFGRTQANPRKHERKILLRRPESETEVGVRNPEWIPNQGGPTQCARGTKL